MPILMHKNTELIHFTDSHFELLTQDTHLLPYAMQRNPNFITFHQWFTQRSIPLSRANAKWILNHVGATQTDALHLAYVTKAFSLNDVYWVKQDNDTTDTWESLNLYNNSFSETLRDIALVGYSKQITIGGNIETPETSTDGTYAKCWNRESDGIYMYKSSNGDKGIQAEYISSLIASRLGLNHVNYTIDTFEGIPCSKCKNMCNTEVSRLPMYSDLTYKNAFPKSIYDYLQILPKIWYKDFYKMLLLDGLIGNTDRHLGNWGILIDANTNQLMGFHPLFDHNCAINPNVPMNLPHPSLNDETIIGAAKVAYLQLEELHDKLNDLAAWYNLKSTTELFKSLYKSTTELNYLKTLLENIRRIKS
jgi:hypothetical protein